MDWLLLLGRILFALLFAMNGALFHLRNRQTAIGYSKMMGAPAAGDHGRLGAALILFFLYQQFGDQIGLDVGPEALVG